MANIRTRSGLPVFNRSFGDFYNMMDSFFSESSPNILDSSFKIDVLEEKDAYKIEAELPGFEKSEISVSMKDELLTLSAEHSEEIENEDKEKNYIHRERRKSSVERRIYLKGVDEGAISAKLEKGILKINVPKKQLKEEKKIEIE